MKILHVISTLDPSSGGPADGLKNIVAYYSANNIYSEVVTLDDDAISDIPVVPEINCLVHRLGKGRLKYQYSKKLAEWLDLNVSRFDAVIINGLWQYTGVAAYKAARKHKIPYYVFSHGMLDPWFKRTYPLKHIKKQIFWWVYQGDIIANAASVLFTCEEERVLATNSFYPYRAKGNVVGYGTSVSVNEDGLARSIFLDAFPELNGKRFILFLSRIHEKKGCDLLIKAFSDVARKYPDIHLVMAGPSYKGLAEKLKRLSDELGVSDRILWTGMLKGDLKWGAYMAADAFVLPSHQENFGIVVAEALALSLPVLISNKVNIWREVERDGAGLVANDDQEGVESLLNAWLTLSGTERDVFRKNAFACYQRNFQMEAAARKLVSIIGDNIKKK